MFARGSRIAGLLSAAVLACGPAGATDAPVKAVDYIIPFGKGGESDISAWLQEPFLATEFGIDLTISYKPGGGGALAWKELNDMAADGSVIMGINLPHIALQPLRADPPYQTEDLTPVYWFHYTPDAIVVRADSTFETLADLVAEAKENPGTVTFSGSGEGTANHLAQVMFDKLAGIETNYVPFKGTAASVTALKVEQVSAQWGYTTTGIAERPAVRLLAVAMEERHPAFPDVPTFRELGFDLVGGAYRGVALPAGASEEVRTAWSEMIAAVNADAGFRSVMEARGFALVDIPYSDMDDFMTERIEFYKNAALEADIR